MKIETYIYTQEHIYSLQRELRTSTCRYRVPVVPVLAHFLYKVFVKVIVMNCSSNCEFESYRSIKQYP